VAEVAAEVAAQVVVIDGLRVVIDALQAEVVVVDDHLRTLGRMASTCKALDAKYVSLALHWHCRNVGEAVFAPNMGAEKPGFYDASFKFSLSQNNTKGSMHAISKVELGTVIEDLIECLSSIAGMQVEAKFAWATTDTALIDLWVQHEDLFRGAWSLWQVKGSQGEGRWGGSRTASINVVHRDAVPLHINIGLCDTSEPVTSGHDARSSLRAEARCFVYNATVHDDARKAYVSYSRSWGRPQLATVVLHDPQASLAKEEIYNDFNLPAAMFSTFSRVSAAVEQSDTQRFAEVTAGQCTEVGADKFRLFCGGASVIVRAQNAECDPRALPPDLIDLLFPVDMSRPGIFVFVFLVR
jgi:hypothetical protein